MLKFDLSWNEDEERPESPAPMPESFDPEPEPEEEEIHFGGTLTLSPEESAELEEPFHDDGVLRIEEDLAALEAAPIPAKEIPDEESGEFPPAPRASAGNETVPLSDRLPDPLENIRSAVVPPPDLVLEPEVNAPSGHKARTAILAALLLLVAGTAVYLQRDFLLGLIPSKQAPEIAAVTPARPAAPAPRPEPAAVPVADSTLSPADSSVVAPAPKEDRPAPAAADAPPAPPAETPKSVIVAPPPPATAAAATPTKPARTNSDPVLAALGRIGRATPPRVWLTAADIRADGSYELEGMAFLHEAMGAFVATLERNGSVSGREIPVKMTAPDAVYRFTVSGRLTGSSGVTGSIPPERLATLGKTFRGLRRAAGMTVVQAPGPGRAFGEQDLPFVVEGTYSGIDDLLGRFLSGQRCVIHRMAIEPAAPGRPFNRVRASFSLRTAAAK